MGVSLLRSDEEECLTWTGKVGCPCYFYANQIPECRQYLDLELSKLPVLSPILHLLDARARIP